MPIKMVGIKELKFAYVCVEAAEPEAQTDIITVSKYPGPAFGARRQMKVSIILCTCTKHHDHLSRLKKKKQSNPIRPSLFSTKGR